MQGPKDAFKAGMNIMGSAGGMAAVTAASAEGFLGRITSSANRGIVAISFDDKYIHDKEIKDMRDKPTSTMDGLKKGAKGFGSAVVSGVTGMATKPYEGSKKGAMGLVKGIGMGFAGLFTKPVSGIVDLVSKTTQGIENGVNNTSECK